ncbi:Hsp70 family protein [Schleiferilactobacillus perolens]|jgi:molecular chaperone HscC|uniref:Hsp70 family protein n=1 Tax=Schleiferilactobacillus perolens TaxID=100468 RepID=UPI002353A230|nr:Hsp70 family protein [Schleiferilactobacillus perolens]MCI2171834.1 Hsp70 family protein [Schleiferilactobacillus perolens]
MTVIGIDFGTANSLVGYFDGQAPRIIPNEWGAEVTPTVVNVDETGQVTVGAVAQSRGVLNPDATAANFKSLLGTAKQYHLRDRQFTPTELTALVLKSQRISAERYLHETISEAIVSVPSYFDNQQRDALIQAAQLAGLTVMKLVCDPVAALAASGISADQESRVLVADMGRDRFTVSAVHTIGKTRQVTAQATVNHLGGADFTQTLVDDFIVQKGLSELDAAAYMQIATQMEIIKRGLHFTNQETVFLTVRGDEYTYTLTAEHLSKIFAPLIDILTEPFATVLNRVGWQLAVVDKIVFSGAGGEFPVIQQHVRTLQGNLSIVSDTPGDRVALGVAALAGMPLQDLMRPEMILTPTAAHSYGIQTRRKTFAGWLTDGFVPLIERGQPLPVEKTVKLATNPADTEVFIPIFLGESMHNRNNLQIGECHLQKHPQANELIVITFRLAADGELQILVSNEATDELTQQTIEVTPTVVNQPVDQATVQRVNAFAVPQKNEEEDQLILTQLERLANENNGAIRQQFENKRRQLIQLLADHNPAAIAKYRQEFDAFLRDMQSEYIL